MADALIGHTGFVGGNLLRQRPFDARFNSRNIAELAGRDFDTLVCAGAPAEKWRANRDPEEDRARLRTLTDALRHATVRELILISTVDVYPDACGVDENSPIDVLAGAPYGRHRHELERFCRDHFNTRVVRLPGLFGPGLKKNVIYDLLHRNRLEQIHADSVFQFYDLNRLWPDLEIVRHNRLELVNFATAPVSVRTVARAAFGMDFDNQTETPPARYDMKTCHAALFGGRDGYLLDPAAELDALARFAAGVRGET